MEQCNAIDIILDSALKVNQEKRKSTRVELRAKVELMVGCEVVEGDLVNISLHGAFVVAAKPIAVNTPLVLNILTQEAGPGLSGVKAKVVRTDGRGLGIEFDKGAAEARLGGGR